MSERSLLDVVPWRYGYAHSWVLAALLAKPEMSAALLDRLPGLPGRRPLRVDGEVARERRVGERRADLAFVLRDADGRLHPVAVETKTNDAFHAAQMAAYRDAGATPIAFLPGLTGMLLEPTEPTEAGEIRLYGRDALAAVDAAGGVRDPLLGGYVEALRAETARMDRARKRARGEAAAPPGAGETLVEDLEDIAWLTETYRALSMMCDDGDMDPTARMRTEANDRGIFFEGSFVYVVDEGGLWVDVIADVRTHSRSVAVKAGEENLAEAWDIAATGDGGPGEGWRRTARRVGGSTATVWKRSLDGEDALSSAAAAIAGARFIASLA
jgi:hypothetical protein